MPVLYASQRLCCAPSQLWPRTHPLPYTRVTHTGCNARCKHRLSVQVSVREGDSLEDDDFEGLSKEEDWTVPGGALDSLSSNTKLGKAVQEACDELDTLVTMERQSLTDAQDMLRKLGYKGNILKADVPQNQPEGAAQIQQILGPLRTDRSEQDGGLQ